MQLPKALLILSAAYLINAEPPVVRESQFSGYEPAISRQPPSELYKSSARSNSIPSSSYLPQSYNAPSQQNGTPIQRNSYPTSQYNVPAFQSNPSSKYGIPNQRSNSPSQLYGTPSQRSGQQFSHHDEELDTYQSRAASHASSVNPSKLRNNGPSQEYGTPFQRNALPQQYGVPLQRTAPESEYGVPNLRNTPSQEYGTPFQRNSPSQFHSSSFQRNSLNKQYETPFSGQQVPRFSNSAHSSQPQGLSRSYAVPNQRTTPSQGYGSAGLTVPYQQFGVTSARHGTPSQEYGVPSNQYLPAARSEEGFEDENNNQEPANYEFSYAVKEDESGNDFEHHESRSDDKTIGSYSVTLPDGKKQTVEYEADENGFRPRITMEDTGIDYQGRSGYGSGAGGYDGNSQNYSGSDDTEVVVARTQSNISGGY